MNLIDGLVLLFFSSGEYWQRALPGRKKKKRKVCRMQWKLRILRAIKVFF
ncbi:MAG: hypothetical protein ACLR6H_02770 [Roseburia sp.]